MTHRGFLRLKDKLRNNSEEWRNSQERKEWADLHDDVDHVCNLVIKIDCVGHVSKNFASKIEKLVTDGTVLSDKKKVNRGAFRLGKLARVNLRKRFRNAIKSTINPNARNAEEVREAVDNMRRAIFATLYHTLRVPAETRHQFCPSDSWCLYKSGNPAAFVDHPHR